jgi:hypothetical protein
MDLTLAETARKSAYMSSKRFPIFSAICIILLSNFVTISRIKLSTELSLDAQDTRIKKLEEKPVVQPVIQPVTESGQIKTLTADIHDLKSKVLDLQCLIIG